MKVIIVDEFTLAMNRILEAKPEELIGCTLTKEKEVENPTHPENIEEGFNVQGVLRDLPIIGQRFGVAHEVDGRMKLFSTTPIKEIVYATDMEIKFKTHNSIYLLVMPL